MGAVLYQTDCHSGGYSVPRYERCYVLLFYVNSAGDKLLWLDSKFRSLMPLISVGQEYLCLIIKYAAIVKSISTGNFTNSPSLIKARRSRLGAVDEVAIQAMPLSVIAIYLS